MIPYFVFNQIHIGPITLYTWGLFVGLGFTAGYLLAIFRGRRKNIPQERILALSVVIFLGAVIGSRLGFLLQNPAQFLSNISLLWRLNQGGLMLWGGILGAIIVGWAYLRLTPLSPPLKGGLGGYGFWRMADFLVPSIALGMGIGRLGCFWVNDHIGAPTSLPWGILWPDGVIRHPVALYESLVGFGLFILLLFLQKKFSKILPNPPFSKEGVPPFVKGRLGGIFGTPGNLFLFFLASYSIIRFFLDFLRASDGILADPHWWGLTTSQWISVVLVIIYLLLYFKVSHAKRK